MLLVDSCVIIDYLRTKNQDMFEQMVELNGSICGVIRAECLSGAKDEDKARKVVAALDCFTQIMIPEPQWDVIGRNRQLILSRGISIPFNDVVIATLAIHLDCELWRRNKHLAY